MERAKADGQLIRLLQICSCWPSALLIVSLPLLSPIGTVVLWIGIVRLAFQNVADPNALGIEIIIPMLLSVLIGVYCFCMERT